jgi:hypothetical protein
VLVRLLRRHLQEERVTTPATRPHTRFDGFTFGSLQIDGSTYEHDVVIDRGEIHDR